MLPQDDRLLYTVEASLLSGALGWWAIARLLSRLERRRPGLAIGRAVLCAAAVRVAAALVLSASPALSVLRGPDEGTFVSAAAGLETHPLWSGTWLTTAVHDLQIATFALQFKVLRSNEVFSLRIVQICFAVAAIALLATAAHDLAGPMAAKIVAWVAAFEPSGVFFSGLLHKEPLEMLGEAIVVYGGVQLWCGRGRRSLVPLAVGCAVAFGPRPYAGAALIVAAALLVVHVGLRRAGLSRRAGVALGLVVVLAGLGGFVALPSATRDLLAHAQLSQNANGADASNLRLPPIDVSTPTAVLRNVPTRVVDLFTRPYPWQVANWSQRFGVLGTLAVCALLVLVALGLALDLGAGLRRLPPLFYPFALLTGAYALSVGNAGTGFRYRTHLVLLLIAVFGVLFAQRRPRAPAIRRLR